MLNKKNLLIFAFLIFLVPNIALALNISFGNPVGPTGDITSFFEAILTGILNIIAFLGVLFIVIGGVVYLIASNTGNDALIGTAKKIWVGSLIGLALALAGPSFLKEIKSIVLDGNPVPTNLIDAPSLSEIVARTLSFLLSIVGILAILSLVTNGILYLFTAGDSNKAEKIKTNIQYSLLGFLISGSALIIVKQIVNFIEN